MPCIVYQKNKKTGVIYVYESVSHWDKEKKQSRAKRKCIGKIEPGSSEVIPTKKKQRKSEDSIPSTASRSFFGATYLFDKIGEKLGITEDLKRCFPDSYKKLLSIAYYLILEDRNPLSRFPKWSAIHKHPYGKNISSQRSSDLFGSVNEHSKDRFLSLQGKRRIEKEYWAYDITSISSYSKCLKQVKYGFNKSNEPLPQINLALLFGEKSNLPFYYRKLAGNIVDVKTIKNLLADISFLGYDKVKLVMDRGFYSEDNINQLYKNRIKFLISTKTSLGFVKAQIEKLRPSINNWDNYDQKHDLYASTTSISWDYKQNRPNKGDIVKDKRRMYMHVFFNPERAVDEEKNLAKLLCALKTELKSGKLNPKHEKMYSKYFDYSTVGNTITAKQEVIDETKKNYGYFVLLSNEINDATKAIEIYRNKDLVEKAFCNLKDRLNFNRPGVSSDKNLDGKLFVEFLALIYLSYIKKQMQDKNLFKNHTMQEILDEIDLIECFENKGRKIRIGEVTKKQVDIFNDLGIEPPS